MQKSFGTQSNQLHSHTVQVLTISRDIYNALHPLDQLIAQALERIGKVRIVEEEEQDLTGDFFDT